MAVVGIAITALAVVLMPVLGVAKQRLGRRLGSPGSNWVSKRRSLKIGSKAS